MQILYPRWKNVFEECLWCAQMNRTRTHTMVYALKIERNGCMTMADDDNDENLVRFMWNVRIHFIFIIII